MRARSLMLLVSVALTGGAIAMSAGWGDQAGPSSAFTPQASPSLQVPRGQGAGRGRGGRGGVQIGPGEECPAGMTMVRPGRCQAPGAPAPSILDYRPESTLVAPERLVPKAKYPAIDFHGHPGGRLRSADGLERMFKELDDLNVGMMISAENMSGDRLRQTVETVKASPYAKRVALFTGINFRNVGPGWADQAIAQLEADVAVGAVGVGEVDKGFGLSIRKADGTRLTLDDPEIAPIFDACARLNLPVFIHTAEPPEFFEPIDMHNERWLELNLFSRRARPADRFPTFETLMGERGRLFAAHPQTTFVAAHLAWYGSNLPRLAKLLDEFPNVYAEMGAVLYDLGRQPRGAHDFLVKYGDRILFGKDSYQPSEYPYYWRVLETRDDYFDYYRDYHAFWKMYGLDLPDDVLKNIYYKNALRITPGIPKAGWPQ